MLKNFILAVVVLFSSITVWADIPSDLDSTKWKSLVEVIQLKGQSSEYSNAYYLSLYDVVPNDSSQPRDANYISTVGYYNREGIYVPVRIEASSEVWTIDKDGNWDIVQWLFIADINGDLKQSMYRRIVKSPESIVVRLETLPSTKEEQQAAWAHRIQAWLKLQGL